MTREDFIDAGYATDEGWEWGCGCCRVDFVVFFDRDNPTEPFIYEDGKLWGPDGEPVTVNIGESSGEGAVALTHACESSSLSSPANENR